LLGLSKAEIGSITLITGNQRVRVDEIFKISGDNAHHLIFAGETTKLDYIGKNFTGDQIEVQGPCGAYVGMGMKAGQINIHGSVDAFAACEMVGGLLKVNGNSGDFLGAARPGNRAGMAGGTVIIAGNVGARAGDQMRRGTILVEGNASDYLGARMIAGTIAVLGKTGNYLGCGPHTLDFLPFMLASYKGLETRFAALTEITRRVHRYCGDMASLGRGEILIRIKKTAV
jgi:formylmethanofuran dehydrogenase subunit C